MKVVHVVAKDVGGAARAVMRINQALQMVGVKSSVLVLNKVSNNDSVIPIIKNKILWNIFRLVRKLNTINTKKYGIVGSFYEAKYGLDITKEKMIKEADIINLHWINDGMLSNKTLKKLLESGKKIVWTMHDMYAFTAGCYYDYDCGMITTECNNCPLAKGNDDIETFIKNQFYIKKKFYLKHNMTLVGCSNWIADKARMSPLTKTIKITAIPNPIDTEIFRPMSVNNFTDLNLDPRKKTILFGAMSADSDDRKGFKYLKMTLELLHPEEYQAIVFGNGEKLGDAMYGIKVYGVGKISSDEKLAELYSLADVFIAPSIQENLSNAVMESLACGTPVVAFDIGGMSDMIVHRENGYLAKPFDAEDLAKGIQHCVSVNMSDRCLKTVREKFLMEKVGLQYFGLYRSFVFTNKM